MKEVERTVQHQLLTAHLSFLSLGDRRGFYHD